MRQQIQKIMDELQALGDPKDAAGMARFGINVQQAFGIRIPELRKLAKEIGTDHELAQELWKTEIHEARILASMIDDPNEVDEAQMDAWAADFNSWDLCDQCCGNLFDRAPFAFDKAFEWSDRDEEFVKRAGFALMAWLAVHNKKAGDDQFEAFFAVIVRESTDGRNFVKKAVNWALRQIGKRNLILNAQAIAIAEKLVQAVDKTAQWIGKDALRELTSEKQQVRLQKKK